MNITTFFDANDVQKIAADEVKTYLNECKAANMYPASLSDIKKMITEKHTVAAGWLWFFEETIAETWREEIFE